ncbi:hypothetical protein [Thermoanaerobaculum aquaticum]|uniref:hypothetical protein n=1 Tax=Thermoanaerobaculum aquaticum TaxID=1312852 RepID=UPI001377027B|nr:hypothetical protein [Thermoanaerobaculum aquaticum]
MINEFIFGNGAGYPFAKDLKRAGKVVKISFLAVVLLFFAGSPAVLGGQGDAVGKPGGAREARPPLPGLECAGRWSPDSHIDLVFTVRRWERGGEIGSELVVWDARKPLSPPLAAVVMPLQLPLACFPIQGSGDLMTVWSTGTASVEVIVFSFNSGSVREVMNASCDWFPEVVYGAAGEPYIVLTFLGWAETPDGCHVKFPEEAMVYRHNGQGYEPLGRFPFLRRFEFLEKSRPTGR